MPRLHPPPHWAGLGSVLHSLKSLATGLVDVGHSCLWVLLTRLSVGTAWARKRRKEGTPEGNSCRCRGYPRPREGLTSWSGKWVQTLAMQRRCKDAVPSHNSSQATLACPTLLCTLLGSARDTEPVGSGKCCPLRVRTSAFGLFPHQMVSHIKDPTVHTFTPPAPP